MEQNTEASVCRLFVDKFSHGKPRKHEEMVKFLINHASSGTKLEEWIQSTEEKNSTACRPKSDGPVQQSDHGDCKRFPESNGQVGPPPTNGKFSKCDDKSKTERELGNAYFKKKDLKKSLYHYNQAIKLAHFPNAGKDCSNEDVERNSLAIALANRSAVYHELGKTFYENALKDIDLALKYGYPERLAAKLLIRKADIYVKKGKRQLAEECLATILSKSQPQQSLCKQQEKSDNKDSDSKATNHMPMGYNTNARIDSIEMQIKELLGPETSTAENTHSSCMESMKENFNENPNFENARDCISIATSDVLGRHVIALTDLTKGQVLFQEDPFASVLLPDFNDSHCHHCHKSLKDETGEDYLFPCRRCSQVIFCDERCADAAELYHPHECGNLSFLQSVGIAHLALRTVLVAGVQNVLECVRNHSSLSDITNVEIFKLGLNNYHRVYSLLDHITEMFAEDLFQYSLTASLLTRYLITKSSFLHGLTDEQQFQVGGALLRHICQLVCNAHAITDVIPDNSKDMSGVFEESQRRIATAIFPAESIMNHSCDSNITFHFEDGKTLIVRGARAIKKGDNVYNCYGPHYRRMSCNERQEILMQQYFFKCDCNKCDEELRSGISFADQFKAFRCEECEEPIYLSDIPVITCQNCGTNQDMKLKIQLLQEIRKKQTKGEYLLERASLKEATEVFQMCYRAASVILYKYNAQFGKICDSLARCYVMSGNFNEAKKLLELSLEYVKVRFGKNSEFAREAKKYKEICEYC